MSASPTQPLSSRDVNTSAPSPTKHKSDPAASRDMEKEGAKKPKSLEYHRQVLQSRLEEDRAKQVYISPSDTIMSPCTAKLSAYKSKQFGKAKPQSLFAKMGASKKAEAAKAEEGEEGGV
ncbi:hypothetical protein IMSHALPRED_000163 [Imshaugia aleurites]|uniref:Spo12-like protein n=1 Tax=Imshaugia aleurites TaxID=172621 RepID=A0A8H3ECU8_9LECA|nr:hypothetical protein IMSHALPRED_000163 [Imshaugia aleurites]